MGLSRLLPSWVVRYWPILTRLFVTLGMLTIIRLGYFIPVPGVDMAQLPAAVGGMEGETGRGGTGQHGPGGEGGGSGGEGVSSRGYHLSRPMFRQQSSSSGSSSVA